MLEEGAKFLARLTAGKGGCPRRKGVIGEQGYSGGRCCGGFLRFLSPHGKPVMIEPNLEGSQGCSNLVPA